MKKSNMAHAAVHAQYRSVIRISLKSMGCVHKVEPPGPLQEPTQRLAPQHSTGHMSLAAAAGSKLHSGTSSSSRCGAGSVRGEMHSSAQGGGEVARSLGAIGTALDTALVGQWALSSSSLLPLFRHSSLPPSPSSLSSFPLLSLLSLSLPLSLPLSSKLRSENWFAATGAEADLRPVLLHIKSLRAQPTETSPDQWSPIDSHDLIAKMKD